MSTLRLSIPGRPKGKQRPIPAPGHTRPFTPAETVAAEKRIAELWRRKFPRHVPLTGPIMLRFTAVFAIPTGFTTAQRTAALDGRLYATLKPDKDNIEKLICDALNGLAWVDDAQIQGGGVKRYGSPERVDIELTELEGPTTPSIARRTKKLQRELDFGRSHPPARRRG